MLSGNGSLRGRSGADSPVGRRCFRLHVQVCLSAATRYELRATCFKDAPRRHLLSGVHGWGWMRTV